MKCDHTNGYGGWVVRDIVTNQQVDYVVWVDPDDDTYCTMDLPARIVRGTNDVASTVHKVKSFIVDVPACTFWYEKLAVTVPPLSPGRTPKGPTDTPCDACCQPETCRRINYCAAYKCGFGEDDKP